MKNTGQKKVRITYWKDGIQHTRIVNKAEAESWAKFLRDCGYSQVQIHLGKTG